jgi:hypothetical protein
MEHFFTPARRRQDWWESHPQRHLHENAPPREYNEVQLAVPLEEFLSYRWDWKDLCAFALCDSVHKTIWYHLAIILSYLLTPAIQTIQLQ